MNSSCRPYRAVVIGAGVIGLTTAIRIRELGFAVEVWAKSFAPEVTSQIAAAFWYPYNVFPAARVTAWARVSYREFSRLASRPETGVLGREALELFPGPVVRPPWAAFIPGFRDADVHELPAGFACAFRFPSFVAETPIYLRWLSDRLRSLGVPLRRRTLSSLAEVSSCEELDLVVNCAGLGSRALVQDARLEPVRGQVVRVENPGIERVLIDERRGGITYIVPRSADVVLGGTSEPGRESLEPDPTVTEQILQRCCALEPRLRNARVLGVDVGLRPCRDAVRLEHEHAGGDRPLVIHNYGHGGAGVTLSWGCADAVAALVSERAELGLVAPPSADESGRRAGC